MNDFHLNSVSTYSFMVGEKGMKNQIICTQLEVELGLKPRVV